MSGQAQRDAERSEAEAVELSELRAEIERLRAALAYFDGREAEARAELIAQRDAALADARACAEERDDAYAREWEMRFGAKVLEIERRARREGAEAMREACLREVSTWDTPEDIADAIRDLPLPEVSR